MPTWVGAADDRIRVACYALYDNIYKNVTGTFRLVSRGSENDPIYVPSGKTIIEACNRFLAVGFDYNLNGGTPDGRNVVKAALDTLFRRTKFQSKFAMQKRWGLIRGDAMWHILADPSKPVGNRISIMELEPGACFAITNIDDVNIVDGWLLVHRMADPAAPTTTIIRRQKYMTNDDGTIQSTMNYYADLAWDDRVDPVTLKNYQDNVIPLSPNSVRVPAPFDITLDGRITGLPVYHVSNGRSPMSPFGTSEMAGIERMIAAVNQSVSDEELALALDGLGLYFTTSGAPVGDDGQPTDWILGPGRVVEGQPDSVFERVGGVGSVSPQQDHMNWLSEAMRQNTGTSDVAVGMVDVTVAQSGIALALQMSPLLAKNREKELEIIDTYDRMFHDLLFGWMPVYGVAPSPDPAMDVIPVIGDPMPVDRASVIDEVISLVTAKIITIEEGQVILQSKLGYDFQASGIADIAAQEQALNSAMDPFGARMIDESIVTTPELPAGVPVVPTITAPVATDVKS